MKKQLLAIPNRCTGCNLCAYICSALKEGMFMPSKSRIWITNFAQEGYSVPNICFQCPAADCMKVCPEDAIFKNEKDVIVVDAQKCNGCGDCVTACTYGVIEQYASGKAFKCDLCGGNPACVDECNFGALVFKEPDQISKKLRAKQMKQRITEGTAGDKRYELAHNIREDADRVPLTPGYMG